VLAAKVAPTVRTYKTKGSEKEFTRTVGGKTAANRLYTRLCALWNWYGHLFATHESKAEQAAKRTETHIRPAIERVSGVRFDLQLSLEVSPWSRVVGGGRYRTRSGDLVRVKQC